MKKVRVIITNHDEKLDQLKSENEKEEMFRAIFNHLLRNESGVPINFWESSATFPLMKKLCEESAASPRTQFCAGIVPRLLSIYFDVMINHADEFHLQELVTVLFQRIDQLYPLKSFQQEVKKVMEVKCIVLMYKSPGFILSMKESILDLMRSHNPNKRELIITLCYIVGEIPFDLLGEKHADKKLECLNDYYEALEEFIYDRMSMIRMVHSYFGILIFHI